MAVKKSIIFNDVFVEKIILFNWSLVGTSENSKECVTETPMYFNFRI
jgi:hypothetical protein